MTPDTLTSPNQPSLADLLARNTSAAGLLKDVPCLPNDQNLINLLSSQENLGPELSNPINQRKRGRFELVSCSSPYLELKWGQNTVTPSVENGNILIAPKPKFRYHGRHLYPGVLIPEDGTPSIPVIAKASKIITTEDEIHLKQNAVSLVPATKVEPFRTGEINKKYYELLADMRTNQVRDLFTETSARKMIELTNSYYMQYRLPHAMYLADTNDPLLIMPDLKEAGYLELPLNYTALAEPPLLVNLPTEMGNLFSGLLITILKFHFDQIKARLQVNDVVMHGKGLWVARDAASDHQFRFTITDFGSTTPSSDSDHYDPTSELKQYFFDDKEPQQSLFNFFKDFIKFDPATRSIRKGYLWDETSSHNANPLVNKFDLIGEILAKIYKKDSIDSKLLYELFSNN